VDSFVGKEGAEVMYAPAKGKLAAQETA